MPFTLLQRLIAKLKRKALISHDPVGRARATMRSTLEVDFDFKKYSSANFFNHVSDQSQYGYYYFPYGYLFRYPKWGDINSLGFRTKIELNEIAKTRSNFYLIAVFGGSNGFGILAPPDKHFSALLENYLNKDPELRRVVDKPFKTVNISHPGNVVLNQVINYILFGSLLNPDFVISHSGVNDSVFGQITDASFLKDYALTYTDVLDAWARSVHMRDDIPIPFDFSDIQSPDFSPAPSKNDSSDVAHALFTRMKQFESIIRGSQTPCIIGLEPWLFQKKNQHPLEMKRMSEYKHYYQNLFAMVPKVYEHFLKLQNDGGIENFLDLTAEVRTLPSSVQHFGDICHMTIEGEEILALAYFNRVKTLILNASRK